MIQTTKWPTTVVCLVESDRAARLATLCIEKGGGRVFRVANRAAALARFHAGPCALVYDLSPWDDSSVAFMEDVNERFVEVPVLLYLPAAPEVVTLASRIPCRASIRVCLQVANAAGTETLAGEVGWALRTSPLQYLRDQFFLVAPAQSRYYRAFVDATGMLVFSRRPSTVQAVAEIMGGAVRSLQRDFETAGLPSPKEVLDWYRLVAVATIAGAMGRSIGAVASRFRMSLNDVYRLKQRLLGGECAGRTDPKRVAAVSIARYHARCRQPRVVLGPGAT